MYYIVDIISLVAILVTVLHNFSRCLTIFVMQLWSAFNVFFGCSMLMTLLF